MSEMKNWLIHVHHTDKSVFLIEVESLSEARVQEKVVTILVQGYRHYDKNTHKTVFESPYKIDRIELSNPMTDAGVPEPEDKTDGIIERTSEKPATTKSVGKSAKPAAKSAKPAAKPVKRGAKRGK